MQAPLFHFNAHRADLEREVVARVVDQLGRHAEGDPLRSYQLVLNDAAIQEIHRLERSTGSEAERLPAWQKLARRIGQMDARQLRDEVERLATWYVSDVVGHFDRRVYRFASGVLPVGLSALFSTADLRHGFAAFKDLSARIRVEGPLAHLRGLAEKGTLVVVPTHSSNLDSIVLGWSLVQAGLPPVTYGAGKNLFTNKLIGYFMRNLGAYRVDRRLQHVLYKDVLKTYSQVIIERGYHSLFFPGGTRSRSGLVEQKLKLGLMGSALSAQAERALRGDQRPLYIVPATINYPLVREAETLVADHLKAAGQARYIIEDDEFSKLGRVVHFIAKLMALDTTMVIRFGAPLDVFGNQVDDGGAAWAPAARCSIPPATSSATASRSPIRCATPSTPASSATPSPRPSCARPSSCPPTSWAGCSSSWSAAAPRASTSSPCCAPPAGTSTTPPTWQPSPSASAAAWWSWRPRVGCAWTTPSARPPSTPCCRSPSRRSACTTSAPPSTG
ncbi:MAG: 1-acyl-sn-glycerol-3-phosphate acyltransferase [bacterium]